MDATWQGGVAAILQRLHLNAMECDHGSVASSSSDGEDHLEGTSTHTDESFHLRQGGIKTLTIILFQQLQQQWPTS